MTGRVCVRDVTSLEAFPSVALLTAPALTHTSPRDGNNELARKGPLGADFLRLCSLFERKVLFHAQTEKLLGTKPSHVFKDPVRIFRRPVRALATSCKRSYAPIAA